MKTLKLIDETLLTRKRVFKKREYIDLYFPSFESTEELQNKLDMLIATSKLLGYKHYDSRRHIYRQSHVEIHFELKEESKMWCIVLTEEEGCYVDKDSNKFIVPSRIDFVTHSPLDSILYTWEKGQSIKGIEDQLDRIFYRL